MVTRHLGRKLYNHKFVAADAKFVEFGHATVTKTSLLVKAPDKLKMKLMVGIIISWNIHKVVIESFVKF